MLYAASVDLVYCNLFHYIVLSMIKPHCRHSSRLLERGRGLKFGVLAKAIVVMSCFGGRAIAANPEDFRYTVFEYQWM